MSTDKVIKIFLASDSTVQAYSEENRPQAGWGEFIGKYFSNDVEIVNHAIGGRSSKTFVEEGRLDAILEVIQPGDYLFVQMGHNDATPQRPQRYTEPYTSYKQYLKMYIEGARKKDAIPVFITPVGRLHYEKGKFINSFPEYCKAMKELAEELDVRLVDLMSKSLDYFTSIGYDEAYKLFMISSNGTDTTHLTVKGANEAARLVAEGVKELSLNISEFVK